ncbi:hypothetical protein JCM10207_004626 [Rhodosporidiobolus poonsookiae]
MTTRSLKADIAHNAHALLSLRSTSTQHTAALVQLERLVAQVVLDPSPRLDALLRSQDSLGLNLTAVLLEWLGRALARQEINRGEDVEHTWENMVRCLRLFQGLLLLHRPSQRLFSRKSSFEYLLAVLDLARPAHPFSPSLSSPKPFPSPVIFPTSPALASTNLSENGKASSKPADSTAAEQLALAALDALLSAVVDRPKNMRIFEDIGGLATLIKVLKDKSVAQGVRIKVIELLYYYLLPEASSSTPAASPSLDSSVSSAASSVRSALFASNPDHLPDLLAGAADFIPQTPVKPRTSTSTAATPHAHSSSGASSRPTSSRESSPSRTPRRAGHARSQSLLDFSTPSSFAASTSTSRPPLAASSRPLSSRPLFPSSSTAAYTPARSRRASRPFTSREAPISESDTDADADSDRASASAGSDRERERDQQPTPRASRLSGLLSSAAAALPSASSAMRRGHRRAQSTSAAGLPPPPPAGLAQSMATPRRPRASKGSSDAEEMPPPPVPLSSFSSTSRSSSSSLSSASVARSSSSRPSSHTRSRSLASSFTPSAASAAPPPSPGRTPRRSLDPPTAAPPPPPPKHGHLRSGHEKRELLRRVMPNVDALEERFRAMGLGLG